MYFQSKARNEGDTGIREQPGTEEEKRAENEGQKKTGEGMEGWKEGSGAERKANEKKGEHQFRKSVVKIRERSKEGPWMVALATGARGPAISYIS